MSWVLILDSDIAAKPPAVIGGYPTREAAEQAGFAATEYGKGEPNTFGDTVVAPRFNHFSVIPGAACSEPRGATHSHTTLDVDYARQPVYRVTRQTFRESETI